MSESKDAITANGIVKMLLGAVSILAWWLIQQTLQDIKQAQSLSNQNFLMMMQRFTKIEAQREQDSEYHRRADIDVDRLNDEVEMVKGRVSALEKQRAGR